MMSLDQIAADVSQNWALYVSMPFVAATICARALVVTADDR